KAADKAEQHYIAAGQYLKTLKAEHGGTWTEWERLLKAKVGIGKSRASELMMIADGRKTLADVRAGIAQRLKRHLLRYNGENKLVRAWRSASEAEKDEFIRGGTRRRFVAISWKHSARRRNGS